MTLRRFRAHTHFRRRCLERNICGEHQIDDLFTLMKHAATQDDQCCKMVKRDPGSEAAWYRFTWGEIIAYAPMVQGGDGMLYPKTVFNQAEWSNKRASIKFRARYNGNKVPSRR